MAPPRDCRAVTFSEVEIKNVDKEKGKVTPMIPQAQMTDEMHECFAALLQGLGFTNVEMDEAYCHINDICLRRYLMNHIQH